MNNRTQQRFDRSILEAVEATRQARDAMPRRDVRKATPKAKRQPEPKGLLFLDPETGATCWAPAGTPAYQQAVARRTGGQA